MGSTRPSPRSRATRRTPGPGGPDRHHVRHAQHPPRTPSDRQPSLVVLLDRERCCSAGQCWSARRPEVFEQDEEGGRVTLLLPEPDARHADEVRFAAETCAPAAPSALVDEEEPAIS
ncbi:ferredoxin [Streptomyces sp. L7]